MKDDLFNLNPGDYISRIVTENGIEYRDTEILIRETRPKLPETSAKFSHVVRYVTDEDNEILLPFDPNTGELGQPSHIDTRKNKTELVTGLEFP